MAEKKHIMSRGSSSSALLGFLSGLASSRGSQLKPSSSRVFFFVDSWGSSLVSSSGLEPSSARAPRVSLPLGALPLSSSRLPRGSSLCRSRLEPSSCASRLPLESSRLVALEETTRKVLMEPATPKKNSTSLLNFADESSQSHYHCGTCLK